jgi:predicted RNA-binding protein with RPS1 domain
VNLQRTPQTRGQRPKGRSPAERAEEFTAKQRQLKREAAERREAAKAADPAQGKRLG